MLAEGEPVQILEISVALCRGWEATARASKGFRV